MRKLGATYIHTKIESTLYKARQILHNIITIYKTNTIIDYNKITELVNKWKKLYPKNVIDYPN